MHERFTPVLIASLAFLLCAVIGLRLAWTSPFPGFDELEHVSFVATMQDAPTLRPDYKNHTALEREDLGIWNPRQNYIGHPVPYYLLMSRFIDRSQPSPLEAVRTSRLVSLGLILAGLAAALHGGILALRGDRLGLVVFCALVALCPELLSVSTMVNNDALGFLGGALAFCAMVGQSPPEWAGQGWRKGTNGSQHAGYDVLAGVGLLLALWAKPNAGLETGLMLGFVLVLRSDWRPRLLACLILGGLIGVLPYADLLLRYGKLVPVAAEDVGFTPHLDSWTGYPQAFLELVGKSWGFLCSALWPQTGLIPALTVIAFWATLGWIAWSARRTGPGLARIALAAPIVFAAVLAIHIWFSATRLGFSLTAPSFRYYLPLWPALAYAVARGIAIATPLWRNAARAVAAALLALGWLVAI
jgi:hypothetical protein